MEPPLPRCRAVTLLLLLIAAGAAAQTDGPWQDCDGLTTHLTVGSEAMVPGLPPGRRLLATCFTHAIQGSSIVAGQVRLESLSPSLRRGDLVAFRRPGNPDQTDIRRVIGFPGDRVQVREYRVLIDDTLLPTAYIGPEQLVDADSHRLPVVRLHETMRRGVLGYDVLIPEDSTGSKGTWPAERVPLRFIFVLPDNRAAAAYLAEPHANLVPVVNLIARVDVARSK
jgi:signal peptidase I